MHRRTRTLAALAALLGSACGASAPETEGAQLYATMGCVACHGMRREGSPLAPPLPALAGRWSEADLIEYLRDPQAYAARDARLAEQAQRFPQLMPPYGSLAPADLAALARFLLLEEGPPH